MDDHALLREYIELHSEKAFSELVERHLPLVYGTALRLAGNSHAAQDIAQVVFIQLARKAWTIRNGHALAGWLYRATRHAAYAMLRGEIRRRERETAAMNLAEQNLPSSSIAEQIAPLLDEAMGCLSRTEQDALLLRYFQDKNIREVGSALGLNEDAARKRTDRALDKIRLHFSRLGVTATAALLDSALTSHAATPWPVGLTAKVVRASLASATHPDRHTHLFTKIIIMSAQIKIVSSAIIILLIALLFFMNWPKFEELRQPPQTNGKSSPAIATNPSTPPAAVTSTLTPSVAAPVLPPVSASASPSALTPAEAQKAATEAFVKTSRGKTILNNLRTLAEAGKSYMRHTGVTSASYDDLVGSATDSYIRSIPPVMGEDYTSFHESQADTQVQITTPDGSIVTYDL